MRFEKWEGIGNDFVLVAADVAQACWGPAGPSPEQVQRLCDRRRGIGADGLLLVGALPSGSPSMRVHNADGSRAEMCGNGLRCVAGFVAEHRSLSEGEIGVQTDAGERRCSFRRMTQGVYSVQTAMGVARLGPLTQAVVRGRELSFRRADVGNPHAVSFDACPDRLVDQVARKLDRSTPGGCNVEICRLDEAELRLEVTVWERGVGRTLGCGTGACAAAAVAVSNGALPAGQALEVCLPGGALRITVHAPGLELDLEGPARRVFAGELG
jgi:diaminopimelate epimerase